MHKLYVIFFLILLLTSCKPESLQEYRGVNVAKNARVNTEQELGRSIISEDNLLEVGAEELVESDVKKG